jgi:hypothetical protein
MTDLTAGLSPEHEERLLAAIDLIGRTGAHSFEVGFDDDQTPTTWWAQARYSGRLMFTDDEPDPLHAVEQLLLRIVNGGRCTHCRRTTTVGASPIPFKCAYVITAGRYEPACQRRAAAC